MVAVGFEPTSSKHSCSALYPMGHDSHPRPGIRDYLSDSELRDLILTHQDGTAFFSCPLPMHGFQNHRAIITVKSAYPDAHSLGLKILKLISQDQPDNLNSGHFQQSA